MAYDIFDVYNLADPVEAAAAGQIAAFAATYFPAASVQVLTTRDAPVKDTPRVEVSFSLGVAQNYRTAAGQDPSKAKQVPNGFAFTLTMVVATTRPVGSNNADIHGRLVGLVLYALSAYARPFTDQNLPLHQVLDMLPAQVAPRVQDRKNQDLTTIQLAGVIAIRNGAWDTPQPPTPPTP